MSIRTFFIFFAAGLVAAVAALWISIPDVAPLRSSAPAETAFMRLRKDEAEARGKRLRIEHIWVPLDQISPSLQRGVIVAEDASFYDHHGIDWDGLREALVRDIRQRRFVRGGSTLTQQLAKNLYLSPSRNPIRKIRELLITKRLEDELSKRRIFELYLNSIEWGEGVFGAEAAARRYFGVSAAALTAEQSALLTAIIPNPRKFGPRLQSKYVQKRKALILRRIRSTTVIVEEPDETADENNEAP